MTTPLSSSRRQAIRAASQWYVTLDDPQLDAETRARWQQWYQQDCDNQWAWQHVEQLHQQLSQLPVEVASQTLQHSVLTRRRVLKSLAVLLGVGAGWQLWRAAPSQGLGADYRTATGEIRHYALDDNTQLVLNTHSAANVQYSAKQRAVHLLYGQLAIHTAKDPQQRPFKVITSQAELTALGTAFTVWQQDKMTLLEVQHHAVSVQLANMALPPRIISAGEYLRFTHQQYLAQGQLAVGSDDWISGQISFQDRPLEQVINTLARYRLGHLACDPSVAMLRLTGTFSLRDTDQALTLITRILPVKVTTLTRYWVTVTTI